MAFLHLICQLLNHYPAISPQWSPIIHPASLLQPQGQNAYENHYENNVSLCLRNVAYMFGASFLCSFCVVCLCCVLSRSVWREENCLENAGCSCFSFSFFHGFYYYWKAVKRSLQKQRDESWTGNAFVCLDTMFCLSLSVFDSISLRKTQKSNVPWAIPARPIPVCLCCSLVCVF